LNRSIQTHNSLMITIKMILILFFQVDDVMEAEANSSSGLYPAGEVNCSLCLNELCLDEADYALYKSWVSVDTYELVLISINVIVFLTGLVGNSLVRDRVARVLPDACMHTYTSHHMHEHDPFTKAKTEAGEAINQVIKWISKTNNLFTNFLFLFFPSSPESKQRLANLLASPCILGLLTRVRLLFRLCLHGGRGAEEQHVAGRFRAVAHVRGRAPHVDSHANLSTRSEGKLSLANFKCSFEVGVDSIYKMNTSSIIFIQDEFIFCHFYVR